MNEEIIDFKNNSTFLGRNGVFKSQGLSVINYGEIVKLNPITSKNEFGRCFINIPKSEIPALIAKLQSLI